VLAESSTLVNANAEKAEEMLRAEKERVAADLAPGNIGGSISGGFASSNGSLGSTTGFGGIASSNGSLGSTTGLDSTGATYCTPNKKSTSEAPLSRTPVLQRLSSIGESIGKLIDEDPDFKKLLEQLKELKSDARFATTDNNNDLILQKNQPYILKKEREEYAKYIESTCPEFRQKLKQLEKGFNESFDEQEKLINDCSVLANKNQELFAYWLCSSRLLDTSYKFSFRDPAVRAEQAVATPFDKNRTPPPNIPKASFSAKRSETRKKPVSDFKDVLQKRSVTKATPEVLRNLGSCNYFSVPDRKIALDLVMSIRTIRMGLAAELMTAVQSDINQYTSNTNKLLEYKKKLTTRLEETQKAINAQLQEADKHLEEWEKLTAEFSSTGGEERKEGEVKKLESQFDEARQPLR